MRRLMGISLALSLLALLLPCSAMGQGTDPPPPCCRKFVVTEDPVPAAQPLELQASAEPVARLHVSDAVMRRSGLSRREVVDRFALGFFGLKSVDLLVPSTDFLDPRIPLPGRERFESEPHPGAEEMLVAVQVRRFYRIPKSQVQNEDIDTVDQLFITDGEIYLTVNFDQ